MQNQFSVDDLLEFLSHAGERGLMPAATAQALSVAVRNVFVVLSDEERTNLRADDLDSSIKRFTNKRAKEFNPSSLKEYSRRVRRAVDLYVKWRENPADFSVKTRVSSSPRKGRPPQPEAMNTDYGYALESERSPTRESGGYQTGFPVRPGRIVTILNVPEDLTANEAERLAQFVRMLAVQ